MCNLANDILLYFYVSGSEVLLYYLSLFDTAMPLASRNYINILKCLFIFAF